MTIAQIVEEILRDNPKARNSDKELIRKFLEYVGVELTDRELEIIYSVSFETITRCRRAIQDGGRGKYLADPNVAKERRFKSWTMQQRMPQTPAEKIPQVMQQEFHYPDQWR